MAQPAIEDGGSVKPRAYKKTTTHEKAQKAQNKSRNFF
jgi:hypothetical protein